MPTEHIISQEEKNKELLAAAETGDFERAKKSVELGAKVDAKNNYGYTPLIFATKRGYENIVGLLISKKANVNVEFSDPWERWTPLLFAAHKGYGNIAKLLIKGGADVNAQDKDGYTSLHFAARNGNFETARFLLEYGADINSQDENDYTPLTVAVDNGRDNIVELLINRKEANNINTKTSSGYTPLFYAIQHGYENIVRLLIGKGADVNFQLHCRPWPSLTPLIFAAQKGNFQIVEALLSAGADPTIQNSVGKTALDYAKENGEQEIVMLLEKPQKVAQLKRTISEVTEDDGTFKRVRLEEVLKRKNSEKVAENTIPSKKARLEETQVTESFGKLSL